MNGSVWISARRWTTSSRGRYMTRRERYIHRSSGWNMTRRDDIFIAAEVETWPEENACLRQWLPREQKWLQFSTHCVWVDRGGSDAGCHAHWNTSTSPRFQAALLQSTPAIAHVSAIYRIRPFLSRGATEIRVLFVTNLVVFVTNLVGPEVKQ